MTNPFFPLRGRNAGPHSCAALALLVAAPMTARAQGQLASARTAATPTAGLSVDVSAKGTPVSPTLFGIFFEEINHAGDGGLYAEMVRNRSFEDSDKGPDGWTLVAGRDAKGEVRLDTSKPLNGKNPRALRLEVTLVGKEGVGAANAGYWGVPATKGRRYKVSLYSRADAGYKGTLRVSLESADGKTWYGSGTLPTPGAEWKAATATLTANATDPDARLVVRADAPGVIYLDMVSLFPGDTFKGRENGLRPDLAQMVADLKPAFLRFPGGCFVEGDRLSNALRWKETVGDPAERPGHWNLWGYRSTDGLGFHEYLLLCEDLKAEPLFVVNCGMSHQGNVPESELEPWVQDALDALEYANGPVTSKWGALRAKHGHPRPFNIRYVEVGNENGGPAYDARYARFYDAIRKQYPDVKIVANDWGGTPKSRPFDLVDEHIYTSSEALAARKNYYDARDRKGAQVYVGEYAVTRGAGTGNLRAALGEAAYMTGLERNGDIVTMASYAPLFVNVRDRKWNPDAIVFDAHRAYGTPSYWVQQMFRVNQVTRALPATLTQPAAVAGARLPEHNGAVGVGTWRTQAEYKDIRVTSPDGKTLLAPDIAGSGTKGWRTLNGEWKAADGSLVQTSGAENVRAVIGDPSWGDYDLTLKARKTGGAEGFLVMFHARDDDNWFWWNVGGWNNTRHAIEKTVDGAPLGAGGSVNGSIETGRWYDLKVSVRGSRIQCFLDGKLIHDYEDKAPEPLAAVAGMDDKRGEFVLKVVNLSGQPQPLDVRLPGASVAAEGTEAVLTSARPTDENSFDAPRKIAPVTRPVSGLSATFTRTFAPYSVTILRVKAK